MITNNSCNSGCRNDKGCGNQNCHGGCAHDCDFCNDCSDKKLIRNLTKIYNEELQAIVNYSTAGIFTHCRNRELSELFEKIAQSKMHHFREIGCFLYKEGGSVEVNCCLCNVNLSHKCNICCCKKDDDYCDLIEELIKDECEIICLYENILKNYSCKCRALCELVAPMLAEEKENLKALKCFSCH